jgi:hypothetical protein
MAINKLSKQAEQKLTEALEKVAELVADGQHPNEAIVKIASDEGIPAGHINLMVSAFNTGRTETQRKICDDVFEKAAEFDLADAEDILKKMYPDSVKTAAEVITSSVIAEEYSLPPTWHTARVKKSSLLSELPPLQTRSGKVVTEVAPLPVDPMVAMKKAHASMKDTQREIENRRGEVSNLHDTLLSSITKLAEYFQRPGCEPFLSVKANMVRTFGKQASTLFSILESKNKKLAKQASSDREYFSLVNFQQEPYNLVRGCLDVAAKYLEKKSAFEDFEKSAKAQMEERILPFGEVQNPHATYGVLESADKKASFMQLEPTGIGKAITEADRGILKDMATSAFPDKATVEMKAMKALNDPAHLGKLRNMQTSALLTDLMANDEIISSYDPEEVIHHYNEISQIAPRASSQEGIVRAVLRKRLAGGQSAIDPFEVGQLLDMENKIKDRDTDPYRRKSV